ncbi:Hca operon transcriptional activator [Anaerotruncus sp. 2789STDY5834896]|uniref:Hca operon transcriptional activator n=1 Tax=uncultured Anaerotruncus sp. TaxID=905011 RepID=A0A1C6HES7_9FIRM|nr:Hca operon transcriptional activator [uncultured Anaerotruncus sp.]
MVEIRVLQYFLAVAREETISGAAESLHLSQPTLSRQLKDLEEELGKQLMIRGSRQITLTEEGMLLRKRAQEIIDLVQKTESEITFSSESVTGDVFIGAGETDSLRTVVGAAQGLRQDYPNIRFHIVSGDAADVLEQLDKGLIDFGVLLEPVDISKYDYLQLPARDRWGVLMRRDAPLAQKDCIAPQDLWGKPLIISRQTTGGSPLEKWMKVDMGRWNIAATYNLLYNGSLMVDEGLGYALCLDKLVNTTGNSNLCFRPLSPAVEIGLDIVWKKYQIFSKAAERFLHHLRHCLGADAAPRRYK